MSLFEGFKVAVTIITSMQIAGWLLSLIYRDASLVDRFWGLGFVLSSWGVAASSSHWSINQIVLLSLVSVWGLRLSFYIHMRNRGHPEDYRYAAMRQRQGNKFWWYSFFSVFMLQGLIMVIVSSPVILALSSASDGGDLSRFARAGIVLWVVGFMFEAGGDWQLSQFKRNPANKGKLLSTGLWSLSRHPNYCGDAIQWWGFGLFALEFGIQGLYTLVGPALMTLFLRKVSGVDLLEKNLIKAKPGYEAYIQNTPAFLPRWQVIGIVVIIALTAFAW